MTTITQQEKAQTREALKCEIARQSKLIEIYERNIAEYEGVEGGEREVARCTYEIKQCQKTITAAASELGIRPPESKRGPGRPPKNPAA